MERNEIGKMFGVKFFETNTPMLFRKETYLYDSVASLALTGIDWTNKKLTMSAATVSSSSNAQDIAHFIRRMAGNHAFDMMRRYLTGLPVKAGVSNNSGVV